TPSSVLIHKIVDCGLLRYRGTRGGRLTRTKREHRMKGSLHTARNGPIATSAGADTVLVPRALHGRYRGSYSVRTSVQSPAAPPTLYVFNAAPLAKKDAVENLTTELIGYGVDIAIITETHLKKKHADSCVHIDGYTLFRRDRVGRKCGGVAVYTRETLNAAVYLPPVLGNDPDYELLLIKVTESRDVTFVGSLYHPPKPRYQENDLLNYIEEVVSRIQLDFPAAHIILAGDLNQLPDSEVVIRTGLTSLVTQPTRLGNMLDRLYVSDFEYTGVKVVTSAAKSDHRAVVAYSGGVKKTVGKTRRVCTFRKHTTVQHAHFLASVSAAFHIVNPDGRGDPQQEYDRLYSAMQKLLDEYYPERTVTITSADPPYITPALKYMLRRKNQLMRSNRVEEASALAVKIGEAIRKHNSAELSRVDILSDPRSMWAKVRQLTGRSKSANVTSHNTAITADVLNDHYAAISTDANYTAPSIKSTVNTEQALTHITDWRMFKVLDTLRPTAMGLDNIPAWFLKIGAPFFAAPLADMMNLSLSTSVVPRQWKSASILPIAKVQTPTGPADFRPISITPILSRILERIVVTDYIYPSLCSPPPGLDFSDQFAFQPTASTTAALIQLLHTITHLLETNSYVIVYALDFSKAFDSVRHSAVLDKYSRLKVPDNIYNWVEAFFKDHSHCTRFGDNVSQFRTILASIIQGSGIGPASYVVTASDLQPITPGNSMIKYADDTYLVVPAANGQSCATEISHVELWAAENNLSLNRLKSVEVVFVPPRGRRNAVIPSPAVPGFQRVDTIKVLGVTISRRFSIAMHIDNLLLACSQTLYALRTLRHHGLPTHALHAVFQATVVAKLTYASSAWWGYATAADKARLESFLHRSIQFGYRAASSPSLASICAAADDKLFRQIRSNNRHLLYSLLPHQRDEHYELRDRLHHNLQLPLRTSAIIDCNFMTRMLFKDLNYSSLSSSVTVI
ncbi:MAG TPA: reverse transcriptase family protein, partial [Methylomicrobium sp.]|nr:reverse transcriptase family protein [Methylomicrobium sp.]